ncbi:hypothetical protein THIOKS11370010 [Thiocapsa sp. KS1]|nr:hypothetical protein THIOKS11370010 [Thiocapsa sp. KS1]
MGKTGTSPQPERAARPNRNCNARIPVHNINKNPVIGPGFCSAPGRARRGQGPAKAWFV